MIGKVLSQVKQILSESPNYQILFKDRDPLKVHLAEPTKVRTLQGVAYRWFLEQEQLVLRCIFPNNKDAFDGKKTFKALVKVGGKNLGTLVIKKL